MKTYKELDYLNENSWSVISTSASMLTPTKIDALCNLGINEINFNLAATDFSKTTLDKMKLAKKKLKVSVEVPLLTAYEKNLIEQDEIYRLLKNIRKYYNVSIHYTFLFNFYPQCQLQ